MGAIYASGVIKALDDLGSAFDIAAKDIKVFLHAAAPDIMDTPTTKGHSMAATLHGLYFTSTRRDSRISDPFRAYREWAVTPIVQLPATSAGEPGKWLPAQVWTRYITHDKHRPIWRIAYRASAQDSYEDAVRVSESSLNAAKTRLAQHIAQTLNSPETGWSVIAPVVVEVTEDEARAGWAKTPYAILKRAHKVVEARARAEAAGALPEDATWTGAFPPHISPPIPPRGVVPGT